MRAVFESQWNDCHMPRNRQIPLTQGQVAIVDDEDYEWLSESTWYAARNKESFYAARHIPPGPTSIARQFPMHNAVWTHYNGPIPAGLTIDHADRDTLNDQQSNLRLATRAQQAQNHGLRKDNKSGYRGVYWYQPTECWRSMIKVSGQVVHLGYFADPAVAARAFDTSARIHRDPAFAQLNFP